MRVELGWLKKKSIYFIDYFSYHQKRDYKLGKEGTLKINNYINDTIFNFSIRFFNDLIFVREFINFIID